MLHATRFWFVTLLVSGFLVFTSTGRLSAQTTPTLFTVNVVSETGQPVTGAEAMLLAGENTLPRAGKWKPVADGTVKFTADDIPELPNNHMEIEQIHIIARAPGHAPAFTTTLPETGATPAGEETYKHQELTLSMEKGRQIALQLVPPPGTSLPSDLEPLVIPEQYVTSTWSARNSDYSGDLVNVAFPQHQPDGTYLINVAENTQPLYIMVDHPGFLQAWQPDTPIATTATIKQPAVFQLPAPISVHVKFENQYASQMPPDVKPTLKTTVHHKMPKRTEWIVSAAHYENPPGVRQWQIEDLPPGNYNFSVTEGRVESQNTMGKDYDSDSETSISMVAHTVIPQVIPLGENGTTITSAEARIYTDNPNGTSSHGWVKSKNGAITFTHDSLSGRFAGDDLVADFNVEVRAPGYALTKSELHTGDPSVPPVQVKMDRGQKLTLTITTEDGRPVPTDLKPLIMSNDQFPRALNYLWRPEYAPALAVARHSSENQFDFNIPNDTDSFRVGISHDNLIEMFWSDPITNFSDRPLKVILPRTGGLQVDVTLTSEPLKGDDADLDNKYYLTVAQTVKGSSGSHKINTESKVIAQSTTTLVSNLAPGLYDVTVRPYRGIAGPEQSISVKPGTTETVPLTVDPPDPNTDRFGRSIPKFPPLKITDQDNKPVAEAQAIVRKKSSRSIPTLKWQKPDAAGVVNLEMEPTSDSSEGAYEIIVRAPGYQAATTEITLPTSATLIPVTLQPGQEVTLKLTPPDGSIVPANLSPAVFPESWGRDVWLTTQESRENVYAPEMLLSPLSVASAGAGTYHLKIDEQSTEPLYMLINHPGYLRTFQAGPFDPSEWITSGTVEVQLPKPATLAGVFDLEGQKPELPIVTMELSRSQKVPGSSSWSLRQIAEELPATSATLLATDLAPGKYSLKVSNARKDDMFGSGVYSSSQSASLDSGESETLTLTYRPFKKEWLQGPFTAVITVTDQKGKPAAGKPYKVTWYESGYPQQTVAEGTVPDDGIIRLEKLAGVETTSTREELKNRGGAPSFDLSVDSQRLGYISFYEYSDGKFQPPADGKKTKEYEFRIPPKEGDEAPDFAMHDLATSKTIHLRDFKGQVVLIDFWATWCGPCQGPMAENQDVMRKHASDWKGKATILALSIDDEMGTVLKHLDKNDWHETHNAWAAPDASDPDQVGWKAPAAALYGINSIPTMVLIDQDGIIRKRGHVSDIENEIEAVLQR